MFKADSKGIPKAPFNSTLKDYGTILTAIETV